MTQVINDEFETMYQVECAFDKFRKQNPFIKCENCISYGMQGNKHYCYYTDMHLLLTSDGFCDEFMSKHD